MISTLRLRQFYTRELMLGVWIYSSPIARGKQRFQNRFQNRDIRTVSQARTLTISRKLAVIITVFVIIGLSIAGVFFLPQLYYRVFPAEVVETQPAIPTSVLGGEFTKPTTETQGRQYVPPINENLPEGDWVIIPQIGVRTQFKSTPDPNEALVEGAWLSPEYGKPGDVGVPIIIAAHRFGWQWWWQSDYGKYHSFYYLPDTAPGTQVEIISGQRKWVYEIYAGEENDSISDYSADLILYTCKHISSPIRFVRYARLLDPTANSQLSSVQ